MDTSLDAKDYWQSAAKQMRQALSLQTQNLLLIPLKSMRGLSPEAGLDPQYGPWPGHTHRFRTVLCTADLAFSHPRPRAMLQPEMQDPWNLPLLLKYYGRLGTVLFTFRRFILNHFVNRSGLNLPCVLEFGAGRSSDSVLCVVLRATGNHWLHQGINVLVI